MTDVFHRSLLILRTQIDNHGAIIAANDSDIVRFGKDTYSYMWGRDGAFVAAALATAGFAHVCMKYFAFCARVLSDEGYLFQHYNPDGSLASNWHAWLVRWPRGPSHPGRFYRVDSLGPLDTLPELEGRRIYSATLQFAH